MIIHAIASEIYRWRAQYLGEGPSRLRVSELTMSAIEDDMRNMQLYPDPEAKKKGETRIAGVLIVVDPDLTIGQFDA